MLPEKKEETANPTVVSHPAVDERLKGLVERIESLEEEKHNLQREIRDALQEAKANGFDVKTLRQVLKVRKMKREDYLEQEELMETYLRALGMTILS
jgi:uncharacterized protein (UPF0335 family)